MPAKKIVVLDLQELFIKSHTTAFAACKNYRTTEIHA
jgi:hypothetical protein